MYSHIQNFLIDIDGVLLNDNLVIDGAKIALEYLERNDFRYALVTNTTRISKAMLLERLRAHEFAIDGSRVITPVTATIDHIKRKMKAARCYLIAPDDLKSEFYDAGLTIIESEASVDFVILGYDMRIDFGVLDIAFRLIKNGAHLVAMHESKSFPAQPKPHIGLGAFVRALVYSTNTKATVIGKPNVAFFQAAMRTISAEINETVMIGDSLQGDIIGARHAGLIAIMVRTGNFDASELQNSELQPDVIIDSIKQLPELVEGWRLGNK
ncbi:HAD-IIA family hydrolase [candidate division KSB1 bacterium]|nr:HAD-IIA family hydrolase [candidate division KSB1 bacterium]